jgi:hypothetical protein
LLSIFIVLRAEARLELIRQTGQRFVAAQKFQALPQIGGRRAACQRGAEAWPDLAHSYACFGRERL